jgi:hypothetical protein
MATLIFMDIQAITIPIIKIYDLSEYDLNTRIIYGLNIFDANALDVPLTEDPIVNFLDALSVQFQCSAHIGRHGLKDIIDSPEELFGLPFRTVPYLRTAVAIGGGSFYMEKTVPDNLSCFFPVVSQDFWLARTHKGESVENSLRYDALALYMDGDDKTVNKMQHLLYPSNVNQADWLRQVTDLYSIVITTDYDGWMLVAYSKSPDDFSKLTLALNQTVNSIRISDWYRKNYQNLQWSDKDQCLKLISDK